MPGRKTESGSPPSQFGCATFSIEVLDVKAAVLDYWVCYGSEYVCYDRYYCECLNNLAVLEKKHKNKSLGLESFSTWKAWEADWLIKLRRKARKQWPARAFKITMVDSYYIAWSSWDDLDGSCYTSRWDDL